MAASTNTATLTVSQVDSLGSTVFTRTIGPIAYAGVVGELAIGNLSTSSQTSVTLPTSNVWQSYIRNLAAAASSVANTITVVWTPGTSGASVTSMVLGPGAFIGFWSAASSSQTGISALSLTAANANVPYEMFLGG